MIPVVPFGIILGAIGTELGFSPLETFATSFIIFGGASQIVFLQLFSGGASSLKYQTIFLNLALDAKALEFGSFTLKSGRTSPYFFNAAKMLNGDLYKLAKCYQEAIDDSNISFDCIYGPAYKGIFLGSIVAMIFNQELPKEGTVNYFGKILNTKTADHY